jgi:hypothetical protein
MMFIIRSVGVRPNAPSIEIKAARSTPAIVAKTAGETDYFCVGAAEAMAGLRGEGWQIVELRDGWYEDDAGGGIVISGHGRYWEVRDTPFTVREAVRPVASASDQSGAVESEQVNVRGAIFGV